MSDQQVVDKQTLESIEAEVAKLNATTAGAVSTACGLQSTPLPATALRQTHDALTSLSSDLSQTISRVDRTLRSLDTTYETPRRITDEHAERLEEQYSGPVFYLAVELLEKNRRKWLHEHPETNGAREVRRHGLTENQRSHLNELQDAWRAYDGN
ncbi:hypothetical protein [Natronosalvus amylolyticus]|uniref:hypothetical protein n=1 Tax=Natronosalvus amylolyticus TaxID=2961994 RepID=UPI0020C9F1EA|nr:hypothetical protein [Natronosalvus amylolyticus]